MLTNSSTDYILENTLKEILSDVISFVSKIKML